MSIVARPPLIVALDPIETRLVLKPGREDCEHLDHRALGPVVAGVQVTEVRCERCGRHELRLEPAR